MSESDQEHEEAEETQSKELTTSPDSVPSKESEDKDDSDAEDLVLPFDPEILEGAPPEVKQSLRLWFSQMQMQMSAPRSNPLISAIAEHLNAEHLSSVINAMEKTETLESKSALFIDTGPPKFHEPVRPEARAKAPQSN